MVGSAVFAAVSVVEQVAWAGSFAAQFSECQGWIAGHRRDSRRARHDEVVDDGARVARAIEIADELLRAAAATTTRSERRRQERLGRLIADPAGRDLVQRLTDEVLRLERPRAAAQRFAALAGHGIPRSLGRGDRLLMAAGAHAAQLAPPIVVPLVRRRIIAETRGLVVPSDDATLTRHIAKRTAAGMQLNVNLLGEAILSDEEAEQRMVRVITTLQRPDVDYLSVKISAICALLDVVAFEHSVERIQKALRRIYDAAITASPPVFVNLDMEEYGDLALTVESFLGVLDESPYRRMEAGIVLQAYLPDSHDVMERVGTWAAQRVAGGGAPIKVRVVKGANLAMEQVDAEQHGWVQAPYPTKADTDASFKRLLDSCLRPEWAGAIRLGVASHNLFDIAWALTLRDELPKRAAPTSTSRCSRGWSRRSLGRFANGLVSCCCTARSSATTRSRRASPTSPGASTRTRHQRTSCGRCSRCGRDPPSSTLKPNASVRR